MIGCCVTDKLRHIDVYRDKSGHFYIRNDGKITQRKLNAEETVRWLLNAMNDS